MRSLILLLCLLCGLAVADTTPRYVEGTDPVTGKTVYLADNRRPALYTGNFGDCMGSSLINVTRFDAAYYKDNMTVLFHLAGTTALVRENLMMYIGVYAYGESRFQLTFNPCSANIDSLCPARQNISIEASGIIPVSQNDVANIPDIALSIPDFEGEAILRIFSNSTQSQIGCYSAVVTNGATFSQPGSVGVVLGLFTLLTALASFAGAIYGDHIPTMRTHYAHTLSVGVVLAVFQHIFFTGALSMNWPSVLVAWFSNFAWSAGMINTAGMQQSINNLIGNNIGNTSHVGAAGSGTSQPSLGGGYDISKIYKRGINPLITRDIARDIYEWSGQFYSDSSTSHRFEQALQRRNLVDSSDGFTYYGVPVGAGLPLPGNFSGFAGTLAVPGIRASNAFMTGFLWFLILVLILVGSVVIFKWVLEGLCRMNILRKDRLALFRNNWVRYTAFVALRAFYLAFFTIMVLVMFQFSYASSAGPKAIAALVFIVFLFGTGLLIAYALYYRVKTTAGIDRQNSGSSKISRFTGSLGSLFSSTSGKKSKVPGGNMFVALSERGREPTSIHEDIDYTKKFGWLAARFRCSRWWFFSAWTAYEFIRACFYGGASGHPMVQVFGLLVVEFVAFILIIWAKPFEGQRLNLIVVYLLGFSKVASVALSSAFDVTFNLARIPTTVIGIIIIVIQGILATVTLVAMIIGLISTYMSLTRTKKTEDFKPEAWRGHREKYFAHMERTAAEKPRVRKLKNIKTSSPELPQGPYFNVSNVRRLNKIEDDNEHHVADPMTSHVSLSQRPISPVPSSRPMSPMDEQLGFSRSRARATSTTSSLQGRGNLPFGARAARPSWATQDQNDEHRSFSPVDMSRSMAESPIMSPVERPRSSTVGASGLPNPKLRGVRSSESLNSAVGVDSRSFSDVPMPTRVARTGTWTGSRAPSRNGTPTGSTTAVNMAGLTSPTINTGLTSPLSTLNPPLTPAIEKDEPISRQPSPSKHHDMK